MKLNPHNLDDLVAQVDREAIQNVNGTMLGLDAEIARLKTEKGYMLKSADGEDDKSTETYDKDGNKIEQQKGKVSFNDIIRSAAGKGRA
jgi:hypothetical protein